MGLSVTVSADVRDKSGPMITTSVGPGVTRADTGEDSGPVADQLIANILRENGANVREADGRRSRLRNSGARAPLPSKVLAADAPLKGGQLAVTALVLALGTFMQVLDSTIANVSLPTISGNLGARPTRAPG